MLPATATSPPQLRMPPGKSSLPYHLGVGCGSFVQYLFACSDVAVYKYSSTGGASVCHLFSGQTRKCRLYCIGRDGSLVIAGNTNSARFFRSHRCRATGLRRAPRLSDDSDSPWRRLFAWHSSFRILQAAFLVDESPIRGTGGPGERRLSVFLARLAGPVSARKLPVFERSASLVMPGTLPKRLRCAPQPGLDN